MAGRDWVECFLKRHPELTLRQSAATSLARAIGFNKVQVDRFYENLKELYEKQKFKPNRIYMSTRLGLVQYLKNSKSRHNKREKSCIEDSDSRKRHHNNRYLLHECW
uniref:HTH CENPB-type domain-containing protein n=1 Tax=Pectinophora gossypiella TaxID=13191 RepID=A0A1E1WPD5_PECGO